MIPKLQPAMQRMAESLLHDEAAAEDVVQDVFVELWERRGKLNRVTNWEAYCIMLVKWRVADQYRTAGPVLTRIGREVLDLAEDDEGFPEEQYQRVAAQICKLPPGDQEMLRLRYEEGLSTRAISQAMHLSEVHTRVKLTRIIKKLKKANGQE